MKTRLPIIVFLIIVFGVGVYFLKQDLNKSLDGEPVVVQPVLPISPSVTAKNEMIELFSPREGEKISSPLLITGQARGGWFFEATFPVVLTDWDGLIIAEGYATAEGEWMTEEFVPFTAELTFTKPTYGGRGSLILQKNNPSGLPENDDALEITAFFE